MTQRSVELLIGRLATDAGLRRGFVEDRAAVLREFREQGHELSASEVAALESTDAAALGALEQVLDRRIRRLDSREGPRGKRGDPR
jgi:hypothetical protein